MSLNDAISRLTESANRLVDEVSNKQKAINTTLESAIKQVRSEVAKATQDIRATIKNEMRRTFYIDNVNGSDDNTGFEQRKPCKTFRRVSEQMIPGGHYVIYLLSDYTFLTTDPRTVFINNNITIRSMNKTEKKRLKFIGFRGRTETTSNTYYTNGFNCKGGCNLEFWAVIIELPDIPADHQVGRRYSYWSSCIISEWTMENSVQLGIKLSTVDIVVPNSEKNEFNLIGNTGGMINLIIGDTTFPTAWRDRNKFIAESQSSQYVIARYRVSHQNLFNPNPQTHNKIESEIA